MKKRETPNANIEDWRPNYLRVNFLFLKVLLINKSQKYPYLIRAHNFAKNIVHFSILILNLTIFKYKQNSPKIILIWSL